MATDKETAAAVTSSKNVTVNVLTVFAHAFDKVGGFFTQEVPRLEGDAEGIARDLAADLIPNAEAQAFFTGLLGLGEQTLFTDLSPTAQSAVHIGASKSANILANLT